ncbi:F-box only protein 30 [Dirofilaria immitis]|nr:F-box only protein 30 [Dirofilaria immitis]
MDTNEDHDNKTRAKTIHSITFDSIDIDDHIHCMYCFYIDCRYNRCALRSCPECHATLHGCKLEDHLSICAKAYVPCLCAAFGCPVLLRRDRMSQHLEHCCASAICCSVQWNRRTLSNYAKRKLKRIAKGLEQWEIESQIDDREIDVCAALVDQEAIIDSYRVSRKDRQHLTDFQNPCHPLMPLRLSLEKLSHFEDEDSSDEENRQKEIQLKLKRSPFENCYLCKSDPSSQHLHVLGNISFERSEIAAKEVIPSVKVSRLPSFYDKRHLCLNIGRERFSVFARKTLPDVYRWMSLYYSKAKPCWGELRYNRYLSCIVHRPPETMILPCDSSPLCDLPPLILIEILQYLDSSSLRCLSSTCRHMRLMCFKMASDFAIVHIKWERAESGNWSEKCFVNVEFSKCQQPIHEWISASTTILSSHLSECRFNVPEKFIHDRVALFPTVKQAFSETIYPSENRNQQRVEQIV